MDSEINSEIKEELILTDTVKLLNVALGASNRMLQLINRLFMKGWTTREVYLTGSSQLKGYMIKHCHKDSKPSDDNDTVCEPLDEVIAVRHLDNSKKENVLEIMFPCHSVLLSFKSFITMEHWQSELVNVTSTFVLFLMKSSNSSIKLGYYLLQFYMNKMIFYNPVNKEVVWMWDISHIHSYQYRRVASELDIIVGRFPNNKSGYFTFTGKRLGLLRHQMHLLASNILPLTNQLQNHDKMLVLPALGHARLSTEQLHELIPCCKTFPQPAMTKHDPHMEARVPENRTELRIRGAYSLNCLDKTSKSMPNYDYHSDKMGCAYSVPSLFDE